MGKADVDVDAGMAEMDADGSGEADFDEFKGWCVIPSLLHTAAYLVCVLVC
jgi:hypothetical protein